MPGNSIGKSLVLTTFGESHGPAVGGILDGFPAGIPINPIFIQSELNRRRTGQDFHSSSRQEDDRVEFLSGIFDDTSTGAPIAFLVHNEDHRPEDYDELRDILRPSHADYTYRLKYGVRDHRGGGRASARETVARVVGGAIAKILLKRHGIEIHGFISEIGGISVPIPESHIANPGVKLPQEIIQLLDKLRNDGDTAGGIITCFMNNVPGGLGEPVFDKLQADLAKAMLSINGVKGFDYGSGFAGASMTGSAHNDRFITKNGRISTLTNFSGGIQGGISNGEEICFRVAFKPVSSIMKEQETLNLRGETVTFKGKGRHDTCILPRAIPIVEAMAALTLADHMIRAGRNS